jgi:eukaryotic-like serine/threonine-protein kinase
VRVLGGRYRLIRSIGVGGMSEVWQAYDEVLDRTVAVKLLNEREAADPLATDRVRAEARCAASLTHPNAAGVYDFGVAEGPVATPYLVMELVDGRTLADQLAGGALPWRIAVRVCAEVGAALTTAHAVDIVHGDIKPGNVMLSPVGAKVLDFGAADRIGQASADTVRGTLPYLAPERLQGTPIGPAADTYALGVLLHLCLTGELPPEPADRAGWDPFFPALDPLLGEVCAECLDPEPANRPGMLAATLILAESVDARIYLPPLETALASIDDERLARSRPTGRALRAPTEQRDISSWSGDSRAGDSWAADSRAADAGWLRDEDGYQARGGRHRAA